MGRYNPLPVDQLDHNLPILVFEFGTKAKSNYTSTYFPARLSNSQLLTFTYKHFPTAKIFFLGPVLNEVAQNSSVTIIPFAISPTPILAYPNNTWNHLLAVKQDFEQQSIPLKVIIIAQHYHAPRVHKQAEKLGFTVFVPAGLPKVFSPNNEQFWVRNKFLWYLREISARLFLKLTSRL